MTKTQLSKYARLGRELRLIEAQLFKNPVLSDIVQASDKQHPYLPYHVTVAGIDSKRLLQLRRRRAYLKNRRAEIERFVDGLSNSYLKEIIHAHYIKGETWTKISVRVCTSYSGTWSAANRYLDSVCRS